MDFRDRVALVTGGSSGIGLATARLLAARGARVWLVARDPARLTLALAHVEADSSAPPGSCGMVVADVADAGQVRQAVDVVGEQAGIPDIVVNSAGITYPGHFQDIDLATFHQIMDINYFGTLHMMKALAPAMIARGSGHIVNLCSMAGFLGVYGYTAYGPSKYAVRGLSDAARAELKPRGINLSLVCPPDTDTPMMTFENELKPAVTQALAGNVHVLRAEAVAAAIVRGIERNHYLVIPGFESKFLFWLSGIAGAAQYPIMDLIIARALRSNHGG